MSQLVSNTEAVSVLGQLLRSTEEPCPLILLGAGASFRSGVPTAADAVKQIARLVYSERQLKNARPPERVKPTEWESYLHGFDWFIPGADRLGENFPLVVEHLLVPAEIRKRVLLDLMRPVNGISTGYKILADFVMRGLIRTMLTTNFDTCLPDALRERQPHIRHIQEVNRGPGDYDQFNVYGKCQIIYLHGRAEQYSDRNSAGEIGALDSSLVSLVRPILNASPIIVIGYRGSEPSIMEGLFGQSKEGRLDFPNGVYWCTRHGETLHPNVEAFSRRLGSNFRLLRISGFDELLADLAQELAGHDRYTGRADRELQDARAFDECDVPQATVDDLDLDLALSILREYSQKLGRAPLTREMLLPLMREQGLIIPDSTHDKVTAGALLLFGKRTQDFFPQAVVSITESGKKREIYDGNLISQHRALLQKLDTDDINPQLKLKKRREHSDQPAYPPRVLVELLVNMLVHRDYAVSEPSNIELHPGNEIVFTNPGALTQKVAGKVTLETDGRIILSESVTDQRNPSLCDIFFGISAMERAGTGLIDVGDLMLQGGGGAAFYHNAPEARFKAVVSQPMASAGSRSVARSAVPTGLYLLNVLPFSAIPEQVSIVRLKTPLRERPAGLLDLSECGTFVNRDLELWSFASLPVLLPLLDPIVDKEASVTLPRSEIEVSVDSKRVLSWLLRKHFESELATFEEKDGLILEYGRKHRAYFAGKNKGERTIVWDSAQRRGNKREVVKRRADPPKAWFENEGFGYEIVDMGGMWCIRIKPFYMFTGPDAFTPLPAFTRAAKATRRIKFDRNKSVEADLTFWAAFLGRGAKTMNVGDEYVNDLLIDMDFLTVEIPEIGFTHEPEHKNRVSA